MQGVTHLTGLCLAVLHDRSLPVHGCCLQGELVPGGGHPAAVRQACHRQLHQQPGRPGAQLWVRRRPGVRGEAAAGQPTGAGCRLCARHRHKPLAARCVWSHVFAPVCCLQVHPNEFFCHPVPLGDNLYNKDRPKVVPPPRGADAQNDKQQSQQAEHHDPAPVAGQSGRVSRRCAMLPDDFRLVQSRIDCCWRNLTHAL